jgi:hypothetical protein
MVWQGLKEDKIEVVMDTPGLSSEPPPDGNGPQGTSVTPLSTQQSNSNAEDPEKISIHQAAAGFQRPSGKHDVGWRRVVRHFTPS